MANYDVSEVNTIYENNEYEAVNYSLKSQIFNSG